MPDKSNIIGVPLFIYHKNEQVIIRFAIMLIMKSAIILHGKPGKDEYYDGQAPSSSNAHWYPWLQKQLMLYDIKADTPEVPMAFAPEWNTWVKEIERFEITPETTIIGHSCGGGFWIRYLSEHPEIYVSKVVLVAPWLNVNHENDFSFFDFDLDVGLMERIKDLIIFSSDNDDRDIQGSVNYLRENFPQSSLQEFHNRGHFCYEDMKTVEFPELLAAILED